MKTQDLDNKASVKGNAEDQVQRNISTWELFVVASIKRSATENLGWLLIVTWGPLQRKLI